MKTKSSYMGSPKMQVLEASENFAAVSVGGGSGIAQLGDAAFRATLNVRIASYEIVAEKKEMMRDAKARKESRVSTMMKVRLANIENGHHFFDPEIMAHFGTRIESRLLDGGFFVTSERDGCNRPSYERDERPLSTTRRYTVRQFHPTDGNITDASQPGEFQSREDALWAAKRLSWSI